VFKDTTNERAREMFEKNVKTLERKLGFRPDLDSYEKLYAPPIPHEKIADREDEFRVRKINVNGVIVRYNEGDWAVRITIEGDLPTSTTDIIVSDFVDKVSALEQKQYEIIRL
jgi:hypothetical protein